MLITEHEKRVIAKAGDVVIFPGLVQHCAMPNYSQKSRSVVLIQYLPKWVRPMEDQKSMLRNDVRNLVVNHKYLNVIFVFNEAIHALVFLEGWCQGISRPEKVASVGLPLSCNFG